jgi:hypothetical protein
VLAVLYSELGTLDGIQAEDRGPFAEGSWLGTGCGDSKSVRVCIISGYHASAKVCHPAVLATSSLSCLLQELLTRCFSSLSCKNRPYACPR